MLDECITAVQGMSSEFGLLLEWTNIGESLIPESLICKLNAGLLFQYPGLLIAALAGAGVAKFLRNPAPWLKGLLAGYVHNLAISVGELFMLICINCARQSNHGTSSTDELNVQVRT